MDYTVVHDPQADLIIATAGGQWEAEKDDAMIWQVVEQIRATGVRRVLVDIRTLKNIDLSILRLYERARMLQERRDELALASVRAALVYPTSEKKQTESYRFFETVARNRGLPYRLFGDFEEAIAWLKSS